MRHLILIPTYNEADNIGTIVPSIFALQKDVFVRVIDDNSLDGTPELVQKMIDQYPNLSLLQRANKEGLGRAYTHAFKEALDEGVVTHLIMMDADLSHSPGRLGEMIEESKNHDLVIGSRYVRGGRTVGWEKWRRILSCCGNWYAKAVTRMPVNDLTGGFNCINIDLLRNIHLDAIDSSGYAFIIELKYLLHKQGATVKEIPITFTNRVGGESKLSNHIISEGLFAPWKMILK